MSATPLIRPSAPQPVHACRRLSGGHGAATAVAWVDSVPGRCSDTANAHADASAVCRVTELVSALAGTTATNAADTPHTDALGDGSNVLGTTVYLVMTFLPAGYADKVYRVSPGCTNLLGPRHCIPWPLFAAEHAKLSDGGEAVYGSQPGPRREPAPKMQWLNMWVWLQVVAGGQVPTNDPSGDYFKGVYELDWPTNVTNIEVAPPRSSSSSSRACSDACSRTLSASLSGSGPAPINKSVCQPAA